MPPLRPSQHARKGATWQRREIRVFHPLYLLSSTDETSLIHQPIQKVVEPRLTDAGRGFRIGAHDTVALDVTKAAVWSGGRGRDALAGEHERAWKERSGINRHGGVVSLETTPLFMRSSKRERRIWNEARLDLWASGGITSLVVQGETTRSCGIHSSEIFRALEGAT